MSQGSDATFITTVDESDKGQLSPRGTYVIPKGATAVADTTFDVGQSSSKSKQTINNQTVVVSSKSVTAKVSGSSLMTEDDSDSDTGVRKYGMNGLKSKKDPKELFKWVLFDVVVKIHEFSTMPLTHVCFISSPCQSKPIKINQRVEAFEKLQTPQKETRTRAKLNSESEVCNSNNIDVRIHSESAEFDEFLLFSEGSESESRFIAVEIHNRF